MARRGVGNAEDARKFLTPSADQLHDPFLLHGMEPAVERLVAAGEKGEKVAVIGDYDVDGVSATALLLAAFRRCGLESLSILPHRVRDGYGFQPAHAERARAAGCTLAVTADCGTTALAAVERALELGIDVVVTDHHLPDGALPAPALQINPRQEGCSYPFAELSGAGLAFKLAQALLRRCDRAPALEALLRIACLGTIADLVPLRGENRVIAALGLATLGETRSAGLRALFSRAGIRPPFDAADVGFRIGPRLNAAGRLSDAETSLELLLTRDPDRARGLAEDLERLNKERQREERRVVEEARESILARSPLPRIAVAWNPAWHPGVVGIAAGRLARELHRPTILLAAEGTEATGSGRSVDGLHLHRFLQPWKDRLERFGGHAQAIGMSAAVADLEELRTEWEREASGWSEELLTKSYEVELEVAAEDFGDGLIAELESLAPFGQGNARPLIRVGPLDLAGEPRLFGRGHLAARARGSKGGKVELLGWGWQEKRDLFDRPFEILAHAERDRYSGGTVLRLVDARGLS